MRAIADAKQLTEEMASASSTSATRHLLSPTTDLHGLGVVRLQAFGMRDADNIADRGFGYGLMGDWRVAF